MEVEWLEEFGVVFCVVVVIRFVWCLICVVYIVLCCLLNKLFFFYSVREFNLVIFCIYKNKIVLYYCLFDNVMLRFGILYIIVFNVFI